MLMWTISKVYAEVSKRQGAEERVVIVPKKCVDLENAEHSMDSSNVVTEGGLGTWGLICCPLCFLLCMGILCIKPKRDKGDVDGGPESACEWGVERTALLTLQRAGLTGGGVGWKHRPCPPLGRPGGLGSLGSQAALLEGVLCTEAQAGRLFLVETWWDLLVWRTLADGRKSPIKVMWGMCDSADASAPPPAQPNLIRTRSSTLAHPTLPQLELRDLLEHHSGHFTNRLDPRVVFHCMQNKDGHLPRPQVL